MEFFSPLNTDPLNIGTDALYSENFEGSSC